jgi:hypothetical protein
MSVHIDSSCVIARRGNSFSELGGRSSLGQGGRFSSELGESSRSAEKPGGMSTKY